jgi:hypothetical protein
LTLQLFQLLNWQYRKSGGARRTIAIQSGQENELNFREVRGGRTNCTIDPLELLQSGAFL